jgi:hypothetical protein
MALFKRENDWPGELDAAADAYEAAMKAYTMAANYKTRCEQLNTIRQTRYTFRRLERLHLTGKTWQCPDCSHRQLGNRFKFCGANFGTVPA